MKTNKFFIIGGIFSMVAALIHVAIILGGAEWYRFFGAGEGMAQLAENGEKDRRLYKLMGLQTIYRKPKITIRDPKSHKFPYLLKDLKIEQPNQLWQTDITYIPMFRGFMYMNAIIDVYSRKILIGVSQIPWTKNGASNS